MPFLSSLKTLKKVAEKVNSPAGRRATQNAVRIGKQVAKNDTVRAAAIGATARVNRRAADYLRSRTTPTATTPSDKPGARRR